MAGSIEEGCRIDWEPDAAEVMLTLAMLTYRAYHDLKPGQLRLARLRNAVRSGLEELPPTAGRYELAWGPAAYRAPFTVFDENVMYIVKHRNLPRYIIAVRGTNPVSIIDWVFGDLWAGVDIAWPGAATAGYPQARVSLSSHLALNILLHLRSTGPRPTLVEGVWRVADETAGDLVRQGARKTLFATRGAIVPAMRTLRLQLRADLRELKHNREVLAAQSTEERIAGMMAARTSAPVQRVLGRVHSAADLGDAPQRELLRLLEGSFHCRSRLAPGTDLVEFLRAAVRSSEDPIEVAVTGHSKGGALSSTLALWLAQRQGTRGVRRRHRWDTEGKAVVSCWSFAGPTAGNSEFAEMSNEFIGDRCHRFSNRLDLVPHAWQVRPHRGAEGFYIENAPNLYGTGVHKIKGLGVLARAIAADVRPLDYRHVGKQVTVLDGVVDPDSTLYAEQVALQHMEGYLQGLGMAGYADTGTFFSPLV